MKPKKKRKYTKTPARIKATAVMRENPDTHKIARAVVELAVQIAKDQSERGKHDKAA